MSTLRNKLMADLTAAMKAQDTFALSTLRLLVGDLQTTEKSGKTPKEFNDVELEAFIAKQVKTRRGSAEIYSDAKNPERAARETAEADFLSEYLPEPMGESVVIALIERAIAEVENPTIKSMGSVMKAVNAEVKGRFDGKRMGELVRARLN